MQHNSEHHEPAIAIDHYLGDGDFGTVTQPTGNPYQSRQ